MLMGIAGGMAFLWPESPQWRLPAQDIIGFDATANLLYTRANLDQQSSEIKVVEVASGRIVRRFVIDQPAPAPFGPPILRYLWGSQKWNLSPHRAWLAVPNPTKGKVTLFAMPNGQETLRLLQSKHFSGGLHATGFSEDDSLFAVMAGDRILVWEVPNGLILHDFQLDNSLSPDFGDRRRSFFDEIVISADRQWLALRCGFHKAGVIDLAAVPPRVILETSGRPARTSNSQQFLFVQANGWRDATKLTWHDLDNNSQSSGQTHLDLPPEERFINLRNHILVTAEDLGRPAIDWLPETWQQALDRMGERWTKMHRYRFRCRDDVTGEVKNTFSFVTALSDIGWTGSAWNLDLSDNLRWLAVNDDETLTMWALASHRPFWCWLSCGCIAAMGLLSAWPRKVNAA
jgi:hypothetical protein